MFLTMVGAALIVDGLFSGAGLVPHARPTRAEIFRSIRVDYTLFTNILGLAIFAALFLLTMRRGATDPVCGMKVDKARAIRREIGGQSFYFCGPHCAHTASAEHEERALSASSAGSPAPPRRWRGT